MWLQADSGSFSIGDGADGMLNWEQTLAWAEGLTYAGHSDWRLPSAKELPRIVDYGRSPDTTNSAAIDPIFNTTAIMAEDGSPTIGRDRGRHARLASVDRRTIADHVATLGRCMASSTSVDR